MAYGRAERHVALAAAGRTTIDLAVRQVSRSLTIHTGSSSRKETPMKIAILGTGGVAHALGAGWKKSGHDVIFGARDASATDPDFEITGLQDAVAAGDVIVNAITGAVALQAITALDTSAMAGKTLLDATNARTGTGDLVYPNSSLAEHLQAALPAVHVVKSLNTAAIEVLADPSLVGPATVFVSGDDEAAKAEVKGLLHDLGWKDEGIMDLSPGRVFGGDEDAEDLLALLEAGTLTRLQSGDEVPMVGEGGPEVDVRDRTPLVRVHPFSILNRQGVLAILALPLRQANASLICG